MTLGQKLRNLRKSKKLTLEQLADKLNEADDKASFNKGRLSRWENDNDEPRLSSLKIVAKFYGKSLDYFFDDIKDNNNANLANTIIAPVIGNLVIKEPITSEENIIDNIPLPFKTSPTYPIFALHCEDNAMEPTIPNKALVVVEETTVKDNEIAAVLLNNDGEAKIILRRIKHVGNSTLLIADNLKHKSTVLNSKNEGEIIGKVIQTINQL